MSTIEQKARIGRLILEANTGALGEDCKLLGEAALTAIGEAENLRAQVEALTFELGCAKGHLRTAIEPPSDGRKARAAIRAAREFLEAHQPLTRPTVPEGWKHDCAALLSNDVELWIDACPHCGKPRTALAAATQPEAVVNQSLTTEAQPTEVGVAIPGWTESDALAILNRISDGPFGQADVDDALEFMRHVDDQRQMKILAAVDEAQPTEAAHPSLMSIINAQADEHAKRPILAEAARERTASWCRLCGEGVVDFCRGKTGSCFVGLPMPEAAQKGGV